MGLSPAERVQAPGRLAGVEEGVDGDRDPMNGADDKPAYP
jgi:hypothetical protein